MKEFFQKFQKKKKNSEIEMSLFPNKPSGAENAMVYFRCGVVNTTKQADGSFKCKADKRKGLLTLERSNDVRFFFSFSDVSRLKTP